MVSGSWFQSRRGERLNVPDLASPTGVLPTATNDPTFGGYLLARHEWTLGDGAEAALQGYIHRSDFVLDQDLRESRTTYDLDFQHRLAPQARHDLMWGVGLRYSVNTAPHEGFAAVWPARAGFKLVSVFAQDEITLLPDTLRATLGMRLERNSYTGVEPQPNVRLMWTPNAQQAFWAAISRAVRMPSRAEQGSAIDLAVIPAMPPMQPLPVLLRATSEGIDAERMQALDAGYRQEFGETLSLDLAVYRNRFTRLRSTALGETELLLMQDGQPYVRQTFHTLNAGAATITGLELSLDWRPTRTLRLQPNYTYLRVRTDALPPGADPLGGVADVKSTSPAHQLQLRAAWSLSDTLKLDAWLRHVSALSGHGEVGRVPAYTELNLRLGWRLNRNLDLALVGQNLLHAQHAEFLTDMLPTVPLMAQRAAYVKLKAQF